MSCSLGDVPYRQDVVNHALEDPPDLARALRNNEAADFLGIADLYVASMCMLLYRLSGTLVSGCTCSEASAPGFSHITHGVPRHSEDLPSQAARSADLLSKMDRPLFINGLLRFLCDVKAFEAYLKQQVVCPENLDKLWRKIRYLF